jgi:Ca-activated chloride channel family protein
VADEHRADRRGEVGRGRQARPARGLCPAAEPFEELRIDFAFDRAPVELQARLTGEDKTYATRFDFPNTDTQNPEIERLWALARTEQFGNLVDVGTMPADEAEQHIRALGLDYQLVTDYTSMVVLSDEAFAERGIERRNRVRIAREHQAQAQRAQQPVRDLRVDQHRPAFNRPAPSVGGGAIDPLTAGMALSLTGLAMPALLRRRSHRRGRR